MGDDNALARRREIRKRKILENAELRKQKIFGYTNTNEKDPSPTVKEIYSHSNGEANDNHLTPNQNFPDDKDETGSTKSMESEFSSRSFANEDTADSQADFQERCWNTAGSQQNFTEDQSPIDQETLHQNQQSNSIQEPSSNGFSQPNDACDSDYYSKGASTTHNRINNSLFSNSGNYSINTEPSFILAALEHPAAPCVLALIVSFLVSFHFEYLVSSSLIIPFIVWELQQIIATYGVFIEEEQSTSLIEAVLLICGIKKAILIKYIWIFKLFKDIFEDFSIYILTLVVWQLFIGFPPLKV